MACSSKASRTYLEKKFEQFRDASLDELIQHGLRALEASIQDGELTTKNCTIAMVGKDLPFTIKEEDALKEFIDALKEGDTGMAEAEEAGEGAQEEGAGAEREPGGAGAGEEPSPMEVSES